jgi:hypothetical protein
MRLYVISFIFFLNLTGCDKSTEDTSTQSYKLLSPPTGQIYHNAYPDFDDSEDQVSQDSIIHFETLANKEIGWVFFSNNWLPQTGGIRFPDQEVEKIHALGKVPYIRMMARSQLEESQADPIYTMDNFLNGMFDEDLKEWARKAKSYDFPLLVEFGTEMNGFWFPWNGYWNGAGETAYGNPDEYDGPEKFKKVYQKIINICRNEGADNITWFFHVNIENDPVTDWNTMKNYYPGDEYIDWIGMSVYGALDYNEPRRNFEEILSENWDEITHISDEGKPIALLEWGILEYPADDYKAQWITQAAESIRAGAIYSGQIKAISYWNEAWEDENDFINLRIDSSPSTLQAYRDAVNSPVFISTLQFRK